MLGTRRALATAGAVAVQPGSADAAAKPDIGVFTEDAGDPGGSAAFFPKGDRFIVCDQDADGVHAWGRLWVRHDGKWHKRWTLEDGGDAKCDEKPRKANIKEGRRVMIRACLQDGPHGDLRHCRTAKGVA